MAMSGLQIYKLLPKTNCKDCGFPTCLAFAMKLAAKQAELSACPHVSEESQAALAASSAPPMRLIVLGSGDTEVKVGNETEMFRHNKTFYNPAAVFLRVKDTQPIAEIETAVAEAMAYQVERVGIILSLNGVAVENASGDKETFVAAIDAARAKADGKPLIVMTDDPATAQASLQVAGKKPMLYAAKADNWQEMSAAAKAAGASLVVYEPDGLTPLASLAENVKDAGVENIVLDPGARSMADSLALFTQIRRLALTKNFRPLGYPVVAFPGEEAASPEEEAITAAQHIAKYGGFIVLDHFDPAVAYILLTLRLNIYTDPQKPIQVSPGIYEIGDPGPDSPLLVTTNFSLTYFSVAGELDGSGMPSWLLITDSEGMSVLTAWAAGNFDAETIAKAAQTFDLESKVDHRKIIIPGYVAVISGELEEEMPGWEILVGPREAVDIPAYLKLWQN
ncbi:MAG: acetyl-CoA decarbonylase/synthase complex subunit gamma [Anaerolineae bacterium]|nr:MAG: acetyl-CoA decarbonylase/synthase complex subunit gamma [Anaerolineae bacterium]